MTAPRLLLMIGLPGSGKSTLALRLMQANLKRRMISTDAIRAQLYGDEAIQGVWAQIWAELGHQLRDAAWDCAQGTIDEVIYDATNAVRRNRRQVITLARSLGFIHITGIWLDTPLSVCLDRNRRRDRQVPEEVIDQMYRCLVGATPALSEGMDRLIRYISFP